MNRRSFHRTALAAALLPWCELRPRAETPLPSFSGSVPFKFSVMLWTLNKVSPTEKSIELVSEAGYTGVELVGESRKWNDADFSRITARIKTLGMTIDAMAGVGSGFVDPAEAQTLIANMQKAVELAKRLECKQIILTSGNRIASVGPGEQHAVAIENLKRVGDIAAKADKQIVIEPIDLIENPAVYLTSVTEAFEIVRAVDNPHVRVLYDLYHEQRQAGNLLEKLDKNIDLVALIHVADVPGRHEPGTGEIRYDAIYRKLAERNYSHYIAMEFYPTGDPVARLRSAREQAISAARS